jgi:hypothetical protein
MITCTKNFKNVASKMCSSNRRSRHKETPNNLKNPFNINGERRRRRRRRRN